MTPNQLAAAILALPVALPGMISVAAWRLLIDGWNADRVVHYYHNGLSVDDAVHALRLLAESDDEGLSLVAQAQLEDLLAARARFGEG